MTIRSTKTVEIVVVNPDGSHVIGRINEIDFDPGTHTLWEDRGHERGSIDINTWSQLDVYVSDYAPEFEYVEKAKSLRATVDDLAEFLKG